MEKTEIVAWDAQVI